MINNALTIGGTNIQNPFVGPNLTFDQYQRTDPLEADLIAFYQWLIQLSRKIERRSKQTAGSIDAIIDKIEEMFPELTQEMVVVSAFGSTINSPDNNARRVLPPSRVGTEDE